MTKDILLQTAKTLGIKGRHEMSKEALLDAINAIRAQTDETPIEAPQESPKLTQDEQVGEMQKKMIAQTVEAANSEVQHVSGKRLVKNTNIPWKPKFYYLDNDKYNEVKTSGELAKAPMQVQLMLKSMVVQEMFEAEMAEQGGSIAGYAINKGLVKTSIEPHVLFAYYRSKMEKLGLVFAGYDVDSAK